MRGRHVRQSVAGSARHRYSSDRAKHQRSRVASVRGQVTDQVAYYGHLLYYFEGVTALGQTNGTNIPGFDLLGPFGDVMLPRL